MIFYFILLLCRIYLFIKAGEDVIHNDSNSNKTIAYAIFLTSAEDLIEEIQKIVDAIICIIWVKVYLRASSSDYLITLYHMHKELPPYLDKSII